MAERLRRPGGIFQTGLAALVLIGVAMSARAQTNSFAPIETPLDEDGVSAFGRLTPRDCLIGSNIDLRTVIAKMADLRDKHAIRSDVDAAHVRVRAWTTASTILLDLQPALLHAAFKDHPSIQRCAFVATITGDDGKGELAYRFEMTRAVHDKTDWTKYSQTALPDLAEGFTLGRTSDAHVKAEAR